MRIVGQAYMDIEPLRAPGRRTRRGGPRRHRDRGLSPTHGIAEIFAPGVVAAFPYSEIEASGVLSLALANGRPVVASSLGNFAETIVDGVQGRLLPPGDVPALTQAMQSLIEDRALAASYAAAACTLMQSLPGWDHIAQLTLGVYRAASAARTLQTGARAEPGRIQQELAR